MSRATFEDAEHEYREAWTNPAHTRFEFPPVDVNKTVRERYRATPAKRLTRTSLWDMETKKAWDAMAYLNYVAREAHSWGRHTLSDGAERWEAPKAATAKGSGMAETGSSDALVAGGIRDCVLAVVGCLGGRRVGAGEARAPRTRARAPGVERS